MLSASGGERPPAADDRRHEADKAWFEDLLKQVGLTIAALTGRVSCRVDSSSASP